MTGVQTCALPISINYEIERQAKLLNSGEKIIQETRGWNENKKITFSQREKEESHDYRYFPEPDLPTLNLAGIDFDIGDIPELPQQKRKRFKKQYSLKDEQVEIFIHDKKFADYFEKVASELDEIKSKKTLDVEKEDLIQSAANYLVSDLQGLMKEKMISFGEISFTSKDFAELIKMIAEEKVTSRTGKDVLRIMIEQGGNPSVIVKEKGLKQTSEESIIKNLVEKIIMENPEVSEEYKKGKESALQFLIGQGMKETKGSVNPKTLAKILKNKLK